MVFPLFSWATQRRPLAEWLGDALNEQYDVPRKLAQAWVDTDQLLPLLDGLDEVALEHRSACVEAMNTFRQDHGLLPLVVCSRIVDYEALGTRLRLQGALVVHPLTPPQVESYLIQVGQPLAAVRKTLQEDPTLWELLETPLMLTIVTLAYAGEPVGGCRARGAPEARRRNLFAAYIDRMFQRRSTSTRYTRQQTEHWFAWLAWQLTTQHSQTVLYLEQMQPTWIPNPLRWIPAKGVRLLAGLLTGLGFGLLFRLPYGWYTCLQHFILRVSRVCHGAAPWRYADFLDYAAERILLRQVGGGYMFMHRLLQDYFATRYAESNISVQS